MRIFEARKASGSGFLLFVLVGGTAATVNVVSRYFISHYIAFEYAVFVAYMIAMTVAFWLCKHYVFPASGLSAKEEYIRFGLVNIVALLQVWLVSVGLAMWVLPAVGWTYQSELIAHMIGVASPIITSYYGHKYFSFRRSHLT